MVTHDGNLVNHLSLEGMNLCGACGTTSDLRKSASYTDSVFHLPSALTSRSSDDSLAALGSNLPATPRRSNTPINSRRNSVPDDVSTPARIPKTPMYQTPPSIHMPTATPSPGLLNPLDGWKDVPRRRNRIFCPGLDRGTTLETLVKRLETGFSVTLHDGQTQTGMRVVLDLIDSRCLRLRASDDVINAEVKASIESDADVVAKISIKAICRLEIGKSLSPVLSQDTLDHLPVIKCFSVIHKMNDGKLSYLDFEASSVFEREAIVSTLMVVLDNHAQTPLQMRRRIIHQSSLRCLDESLVIPKPATLNQPQLDQRNSGEIVSATLSPMKRTRIHSEAADAEDSFFSLKEEGTETSLVYFDETSSAPSIPLEASEHYSLQITTNQRVSDPNDYDLEVTANEKQRSDKSSAQDDPSAAVSGKMSSSNIVPWCTDDICALALKDIAETCSGILDKDQDLQPPQPPHPDQQNDHRELVQSYIANVLGSPTDLLSFLSDGKVWNVVETTSLTTPREEGRPDRTHVNGRLRNRASLLNAQAMRLRKLRCEMTFAAVLRSSREKLHYVQTTQSLDDLDQGRNDRETRRNPYRRRNQVAVSELANKFHSSALLQHIVDGMLEMTTPKAAALVSQFSEEDGEVMYYDSDPEDARERNTSKGSRRAMAYRMNEEHKMEQQSDSTLLTSESTHAADVEKVDFLLTASKLDDSLVIEIAEAVKNEAMTLMWHPTQNKKLPNRSPMCVKAWIENGTCLVDGTFLMPKLTWKPAHERNLEVKLLNISMRCPDSLDLLDICRIHAARVINRKHHPFANARRSFVIETQDDVFVFETQTVEERNRLICGLKLVVARLASLLMMRDNRVIEEFFAPAIASIPGEPDVL